MCRVLHDTTDHELVWSNTHAAADSAIRTGVGNAGADRQHGHVHRPARWQGSAEAYRFIAGLLVAQREFAAEQQAIADRADIALLADQFEIPGTVTRVEIGRASCRERVCQYV